MQKVRVTITTTDGEVLETFFVVPDPHKIGQADGAIKLSAMIRDQIDDKFEVEE